MSKKELISIIVPCYNEEEVLPVFYKEINSVSKEMKYVDFEFVFVDDGSKDKTLNILKDFSKKDKRVRYISFSRNFGKEAAMYAGIENVKGDYAAIMDADMQDPPSMLKTMYHYVNEEGYDCAALYTKSHEDYGLIRKTLTNIWYKLIDKISTTHQVPGARDFRLMTRKMVEAIKNMPEYNRYTKGIFGFIGFNTKWIHYTAGKRAAGESKFNIKKLIKYALEGIVAFSTSPLLIAAHVGLLFCLVAFTTIIVIILKTVIWGDPVAGWPSLACLIVFIGGLQLFFFGIMGMYLSKIYLEVKKRPVYISKETSEDVDEED